MAEVALAPGAEGIELAGMLVQMLSVSLERPEKKKVLDNLKTRVYLYVTDMDLGMTMEFDKGRLIIHSGKVGDPKISIITDSETLLELVYINIKFGMPYYFDETGRGILKRLLKRDLKIKGMLTHVVALTKVTKVISVN